MRIFSIILGAIADHSRLDPLDAVYSLLAAGICV